MISASTIPYCGLPPVPGGLAWNIDPLLIAALLAVAALYARGAIRAGPIGPDKREQALFALGWFVLAGAVLSPLCSLSVALFSARIAQHMLITLVAAPLLVLGRTEAALAAAVSIGGNWSREVTRPELAIGPIAFAAALWIWHFPGPYDATLQSSTVYWAMHLTLIASSILLWRALLRDRAVCPGCGLVASLVTSVQMCVLGALLTLSPRPWFAVHEATTAAWGFSQLEDQELGGLLMWVPGGALFTLYALAVFGVYLHRAEARRVAA